ncbi:hypothetical protein R1flu_021692 [Riccia fluitans]|uniref:Protein SYS1 homolog n=1 Tax=Riccia fluitans TaxID=41844 RepID=A0ABD1ZQ43_9MARC
MYGKAVKIGGSRFEVFVPFWDEEGKVAGNTEDFRIGEFVELSGSFATDVKSRRRGSRPLGFGSVEEAIRKRVTAMFYGATIWDPWLIVGQIVCIQCLYYLSLGLLLSLFVGTQVPRFTLNYFFNYSHVSASSFVGWCTIFAYFINSLAGAGYLLVLIERAKKCLDFSATLYIIHLFFCLVYGGFPSSVTWWIVSGSCLVITAVLGEWLCMRRELKDIPIRSTRLDV